MTTSNAIKYSLLFPAVYFALGVVLTFKKRFEPDFLETVLYIVIGSAVLWIFGLFLSVLISAIFKSSKKEFYFYFAGQTLVLLCCMGLVSYNMYIDNQHEKKYGNIEHNRFTLSLDDDGNLKWYADHSYIKYKIAFDCLQAQFKNPNDFRLTEYFSEYRDSAVQEYTDTLRIVYFTYKLKDKNYAFSRIHVFEGKAELKVINGDPSRNKEYLEARLRYLKNRDQMEKEFTKTMKELEQLLQNLDSLRRIKNDSVTR